MNKRTHKKGFTIVELVIVIAVIAILAAVLIPTFSGVISKANESAALQKATNAYKEAYALALADDGKIDSTDNAETANVNGFKFEWTDATTVTVTPLTDFGYTVEVSGGKVTVEKVVANNNT